MILKVQEPKIRGKVMGINLILRYHNVGSRWVCGRGQATGQELENPKHRIGRSNVLGAKAEVSLEQD